LTITKDIDFDIYNKILEGDEVQIIFLEHSNLVLDTNITKKTQVRSQTPNSFGSSSLILQTIDKQPLTADEIALAKEDIILYRLGAFVLGLITIATAIGFWNNHKDFTLDTRYTFNEIYGCAFIAFMDILLIRKYWKRNRDLSDSHKNIVIGKVMKKHTIAEDGTDIFQVTIKSEAISQTLVFNVKLADFDKILLHDIVKVEYLERSNLLFRLELIQAVQR
jgi:hypothetical protein